MSTILGGRFKLLKAAAKGGTANVYLAVEVATGKKVAVKVMRKDVPEEKEMARRFAREASVMEKIKHPNVVGLVHFEDAPEGLVLLTDWVDGKRLDQVLAAGPMGVDFTLALLKQLASALAAIHATGVIHRDLKPENIVVTPRGELKLLDFGIARFTKSGPSSGHFVTTKGKVAGTPSYLSPEQARGLPCDARTDVYTFGVLAYLMLSGHLPFRGRNDVEIMAAHVAEQPVRFKSKDVPESIIDLVMQCLEKNLDDRPADGAALLRVLEKRGRTLLHPKFVPGR